MLDFKPSAELHTTPHNRHTLYKPPNKYNGMFIMFLMCGRKWGFCLTTILVCFSGGPQTLYHDWKSQCQIFPMTSQPRPKIAATISHAHHQMDNLKVSSLVTTSLDATRIGGAVAPFHARMTIARLARPTPLPVGTATFHYF